jgi:hypothetical protein
MKSIKHISWIVTLLVGMLFPAIGNCYIYQVKLSDGRILKVKQYYEKGDTIFLLRYGNYIGMDKNTVVEITKIKDPTETANSIPANQKSSSTKGSSSKNSDRASKPHKCLVLQRQPHQRQAQESQSQQLQAETNLRVQWNLLSA